MSQTEIICACVLGVLALIAFVFLACFISYLEFKAKREKNYQLERIANACFGVEQVLLEICDKLNVLQSIELDTDSLEVQQNMLVKSTVDFYDKVLAEIRKVGE